MNAGPLRICQVVSYDLAEEGGVKRHAQHLARALRRRGDEVWIVGPSSRGEDEPFVQGFPGVVNIPSNGSDNCLGILTPPWTVRRFFRRHRFDVVHVHEPLAPALPYYALWGSPGAAHVCTFHGFSEQEGRGMLLLRRFFGGLAFPGYRRGIAVSAPAERFARGAWRRPLSVIPNGVPTDIFCPAERQPAQRNGTALEEQARLLFVGNWRHQRKGLPLLLQACQRLRAAGLCFHLDVVGEGPAGVAPPELPFATFHGPIAAEAELARRYQGCDLFVAPATGQESFGIVLLEAMACACPIVCSDIEGYRQVVQPEGALRVPPGDAEALARAIRELLADPARRRRMGEVNRQHAAPYDWDRLTGRVREEYLAARLQG